MKSPIKKVYELYKNRAFEKKAREDMIGHAGVHFTWPLAGKNAGAEKAEKAEAKADAKAEGEKSSGRSLPAVMIPSSFITCRSCGRRALRRRWEENYFICPTCGKYAPLGGYYRLKLILDPGSFEELDHDITAEDPLGFPGYKEKIEKQEEKTGLSESVMGSMSRAVGEKVTRAVEYADQHHLPLLIFSASGGARMQEGIYSLMQMAKTSAAIETFSEHGGLYISFLTHPTTGGVTASFATLGDITLAEPGALIGFAGPRVIEQTINRKLPKGFQRAEYLENHGFVDRIVKRSEMRDVLTDLLKLHADSSVQRRAVTTGEVNA